MGLDGEERGGGDAPYHCKTGIVEGVWTVLHVPLFLPALSGTEGG